MSGSFTVRGLVISIALAALSLVSLGALEGETVSISVRSAQLRERASHLAPISGDLAYADQVEVLEVQGDFYRVSSPAGEGWLHKSTVSEKEIVLDDSGRDAERAADDDEVALAGRGFNEQVEQQYRSDQGLSFEGVDRMESRTRNDNILRDFVETGGLRSPEEN